MSDGELHGRRVLVLGGEMPLGRALAIGLAAAGADVAIVSLSAETKAEFAINSALNELWALGRRGLALAIDASDAAQVREAVERAERELGRLDLAAVVAPEGAVALDALRAALGEREVVVMAAESAPGEALREISERIGKESSHS